MIVSVADSGQARGLLIRLRWHSFLGARAERERFLVSVLACLRLLGCLRVRVLYRQVDQPLLQYLLVELYQVTADVEESHVSLSVLLVHQLRDLIRACWICLTLWVQGLDVLDRIAYDAILRSILLWLVQRSPFQRSVLLRIAGVRVLRPEDDVLVADLGAGLLSRQGAQLRLIWGRLQRTVPRFRGEGELDSSLFLMGLLCLDLWSDRLVRHRRLLHLKYLYLFCCQLLLTFLASWRLLSL